MLEKRAVRTVTSGEPSKTPHQKIEGDVKAGQPKAAKIDLRAKVFVFPPIAAWEVVIYFIVSVCFRIYGVYAVYDASCRYFANSQQNDQYTPLQYSSWIPDFLTRFTPGEGSRQLDAEWDEWISWVRSVLPWHVGHAVLFNLGAKVFPERHFDKICLTFWIFAAVFTTSSKIVLFLFAEMLLVFAVARFTRSIPAIWGLCAVFLHTYTNMHGNLTSLIGDFGVDNDLAEIMFYTYKQLHIVSFTIEMVKSEVPEWGSFLNDFYKLVYYAFYLPYSASVVRIYPYFKKEICERTVKARKLTSTVFFGCRILFWIGLTEVLHHFLFIETMITDAEFLKTLPIDRLFSIGYASMHYFHLKYVGIFGFGQFFAKLDNMVPTDVPVCPGHVSTYSTAWCRLDVGLYDFFKQYVFVPVASPTFSIFRKLLAFCACNWVVLIWHGFESRYVIWVLISMIAIWSEILSKLVYVKFLRVWREKYVSDRWFRAILAILNIWTAGLTCYAIFYFIGGADSGWVFADRIVWQQPFPPEWKVCLLYVYGYFFNQTGFEVARYLQRKAMAAKKAQ